MAEYKNWYLARGSGMKDERKKLKLIILQCIAVITAILLQSGISKNFFSGDFGMLFLHHLF